MMVKNRSVRIFWIGSMYFSIGVNCCIAYWVGKRTWILLSLAAVMFGMALLSWILERRQQMCSVLYAALMTGLLLASVPILACWVGHGWTLILATAAELLLSAAIAACIVWRCRHERA